MRTTRKEYDFSTMKGNKDPHASRLKRQVTMRLGVDIIHYFKGMSEETGIPYQQLINLYLRDCVERNRKSAIKRESRSRIPV
ncbi:MAG TPA: antitoxin [bacterium]|nr:antitoxin [bacterium]HQL60853.1 antitoxin [bacterium]